MKHHRKPKYNYRKRTNAKLKAHRKKRMRRLVRAIGGIILFSGIILSLSQLAGRMNNNTKN
ncbi:MAG: hypothetical protein V4538_01665 [Bacteroidota bacterium]